MSAIFRTGLIAALAAGASLAAWAGDDPAGVEQGKREVVRAALQRQGGVDAGAARLEAAGNAAALCAIRLDASPERPVVTLQTSGQPTYKAFAIRAENKVVLDLANTVNLRSGTIPADNEAVVRRIRTSMFAVEPEFVSRVVVDLATSCAFDVTQDENTITVVLRPVSEKPSGENSVAASIVPEVESKVENVRASLENIESEQETVVEATPAAVDTDSIAASARALAEQARGAVRNLYYGGASVARRSMTAIEEAQRQRAKAQEFALLSQVETPEIPVSEPDGYAKNVAARVDQLAAELESVQASQFEAAPPPVVLLAAVTEQQNAPAEPAAAPAPASEGSPPASAEATPVVEAQPAPEQAPATPAPPPAEIAPPPEKRSEPAAPAGKPVVTRMKELLSGMSAAGKGSGAQAVTTPAQVEATPAPEAAKAAPAASKKEVVVAGNPMDQIVNIDFRDMDLTNVVALLAQKAQINVIAGADLTGAVTASLKNVTLRQAIDTVLRMNNLGIIEEEGIYRIVPYQEAASANRKTVMVKLENAKAGDIQKTLDSVLKGSPDDTLISLSANDSTNMLIIAGPEARVGEFEALARELDVAKPVTPTITEAIKINNAEPSELVELIQSMVSKDFGKVAVDTRSRHIVVTDEPVVLDQVRELIKQVDMPVRQVSVDTMIVDAVLSDDSETGVDWVLKAVHNFNAKGQQIGSLLGPVTGVDSTGDQIQRDIISDMSRVGTGFLSLGLLTDKINIKAAISAQIDNRNAKLLANPVVVTVENQKASINITDEIPYQESKQSLTGPPMVSTSFKEIGIVLEVTPKVSHDDHVIAKLMAKQSRQNGVFNNIPIEAKRTTETTLRTRNGQTIFIGGLRRYDDSTQAKKVPVLGDIPVMNFLFRNNVISKKSTELLVFLTCNVLPDDMAPLDTELQKAHDSLDSVSKVPDGNKELGRILTHPKHVEDTAWHWRRSE